MPDTEDKMTWVTETLAQWKRDRKTGSVTVHFHEGGVTNIEKRELERPRGKSRANKTRA